MFDLKIFGNDLGLEGKKEEQALEEYLIGYSLAHISVRKESVTGSISEEIVCECKSLVEMRRTQLEERKITKFELGCDLEFTRLLMPDTFSCLSREFVLEVKSLRP
jgi:hypothetical protein